jgi:hypothetical protein
LKAELAAAGRSGDCSTATTPLTLIPNSRSGPAVLDAEGNRNRPTAELRAESLSLSSILQRPQVLVHPLVVLRLRETGWFRLGNVTYRKIKLLDHR